MPNDPDIRCRCLSCPGVLFTDERGRVCPDCVRRRVLRLTFADDVRVWCAVCRGPVYTDERGDRCPECVRVMAQMHAAQFRGRTKVVQVPRPRPEPAPVAPAQPDPRPVLYGLLTACDVLELERRRAMLVCKAGRAG